MNLKYILLVKNKTAVDLKQQIIYLLNVPHPCVWLLTWHRPQSNLWCLVPLDRSICWHWVWSSLIIYYLLGIAQFNKCTLTLDFRSCLLEEEVVCVISFQVKDGSLALFDCVMPIRSFPTFSTCSKPSSDLLLDIWVRTIFLAGLCQLHKQYPRVYIWYDYIRQTTATCRNMGSNNRTKCMYYVQSVFTCSS